MIPETGFLRIRHIIGRPADEKRGRPEVLPIIPVARSTWWAGVKSGRFPKPINRLGMKSPIWRAEDIRALVDKLSAQPEASKKGRSA